MLRSVTFLGILLATLPTLPTAILAQAFPKGTFVTVVNGSNVSLQFADSGNVTIQIDGTVAVRGTYTVNGDEFQVTDREGPMACDVPGRYKWKFDGKALTFTVVSDGCEGRVQALTSHLWTREGPEFQDARPTS